MSGKFVCNTIIDCNECPHIAKRLVFQFGRINSEVLKLSLNDENKYAEVFNDIIDLATQLKSLFNKKNDVNKKVNDTLLEIDKSLGEAQNTLNYNDNSKEIYSVFSDSLALSIRIINLLSNIYGQIIGEDINGALGLLKHLKSCENSVKSMIEEDEELWSQLLGNLRSSSEHKNNNLSLEGYEIIYEVGEVLPLIKLPRFTYSNKNISVKDININNYLESNYINIFTFIEDIIAIGINIKIEKMKLFLLKTINDNGNLDSVENVYTLHTLN